MPAAAELIARTPLALIKVMVRTVIITCCDKRLVSRKD